MNADVSESTLNRWTEIARVQPQGSIASMLRKLEEAGKEAAKRYDGNGQHRRGGNIVGGNGSPERLLSWRDL
jgi:hypothetical protein